MRRQRPTNFHRPRRDRSRAAFTLLELMLVLAILVVLVGLVGVNIFNTQDDANASLTKTQLEGLKKNVALYKLKANSFPDSLDALVNGPSDPAKKAMFSGGIIDEVPSDAWGNEIVYKQSGNGFELRSAGRDGQMNSDDDIVVEG
jgi:general secretion pathway protein G